MEAPSPDAGTVSRSEQPPLPSSPVFESTARCINGFLSLSSAQALSSQHKAVEDNYARFRLWAGSLGAFRRLPSRAAADYRLREAPEVTSRILEILDDIVETNAEILSASSLGDSQSGEDDEDDFDLLGDLCLSVGDSITSLLKVSVLLRKATTRDRYALASNSKHDTLPLEYARYDERHVAERFPKTTGQPWLCKRLAAAITQRRKFLRYAHRHQRRIAEERIQRPAESAVVPLRVGSERRTAAHTLTTAAASTQASTLHVADLLDIQQHIPPADDFDDDNLSTTTSVLSSFALNSNTDRVQIVSLESLSEGSKPFQCPYCQGIVHFRNPRSWRKHVLRDLRAYICTFEDCNEGLFEDRSAWFQHEIECHRRQWVCMACTNKVFATVKSYHAHLSKRHGIQEEQTLARLTTSSSRPVTEVAIADCPLCDDWHNDLGVSVADKETTTGPLLAFKLHLGNHQEHLAMFAVTPSLNKEDREVQDDETSSEDDPCDRKETLLAWQDGLADISGDDGNKGRPQSSASTHSSSLSPAESSNSYEIFSRARLRSFYRFETHSRECAECYDPFAVHRRGDKLCDTGMKLAQDVLEHVDFQDGDVYLRTPSDNGVRVLAELPADHIMVEGLLKARYDAQERTRQGMDTNIDAANEDEQSTGPKLSRANFQPLNVPGILPEPNSEPRCANKQR